MREINISFLRQWLNEDRITNPKRMVSNDDIKKWLCGDFSGNSMLVAIEKRVLIRKLNDFKIEDTPDPVFSDKYPMCAMSYNTALSDFIRYVNKL